MPMPTQAQFQALVDEMTSKTVDPVAMRRRISAAIPGTITFGQGSVSVQLAGATLTATFTAPMAQPPAPSTAAPDSSTATATNT